MLQALSGRGCSDGLARRSADRVDVLGCPVDALDSEGALERIACAMRDRTALTPTALQHGKARKHAPRSGPAPGCAVQ